MDVILLRWSLNGCKITTEPMGINFLPKKNGHSRKQPLNILQYMKNTIKSGVMFLHLKKILKSFELFKNTF